jgi:3-methyladenine DNA glycosylase Tag
LKIQNNLQWTIQLDAAGVYPVTYTKNTTTRKLVYDDATLFEFLILETFQAGLSWITILNKRENFRKAFNNFDYKKIALYSEERFKNYWTQESFVTN